ncbi:DUF4176 domain-containing protein [Pseudogracilibacillus auburnensis]|uniref:DUF4176 domain-containing protein n=1 Tax=Pseudogracilibacillus auburnensis TaxID=1494959 RepID=A0A2V3VXI8_9BACI|nr:DUF4176 domain-containing protein [Pseudogracilibacillus auburnensis]MBO1002268.1 DUF4176 domain-containing protein [Pseudogracilibacillus auburnensis]PXW86346.1 hypothetical protein DFR56_108165 [Pseudogracilibacillus auburnensis]
MLSIGSIVYLKEGTSKLMILNRGPMIKMNEEELMFDYSGCIYPQGLVPDNVFYFNHENIDEVIFEGYRDADEERYQKLYRDWTTENHDKYKRGKVSEPLSTG